MMAALADRLSRTKSVDTRRRDLSYKGKCGGSILGVSTLDEDVS
jgi:hypothetical protein